jgi:hypothetical protein
MITSFNQGMKAQVDAFAGRPGVFAHEVESWGIPLGRVRVFTPVRMRNVPDCPQGQGSLGCAPSRVRGTVRPETVSVLDNRLCMAVTRRRCRLQGIAHDSAGTADHGTPSGRPGVPAMKKAR